MCRGSLIAGMSRRPRVVRDRLRAISVGQIWLDDPLYQTNLIDLEPSRQEFIVKEEPNNKANDENSSKPHGSTEPDDLYCEEEFSLDSLSYKNFTDDDKLGLTASLHHASPPVIMASLGSRVRVHRPVALKPEPKSTVNPSPTSDPRAGSKPTRSKTRRFDRLHKRYDLRDNCSHDGVPSRRRTPRLCEMYLIRKKEPPGGGGVTSQTKSIPKRLRSKPASSVLAQASVDQSHSFEINSVELPVTLVAESVVREGVVCERVAGESATEPVFCDELLLEFPSLYYKLTCSDDSGDRELEARRNKAGVAYRILDNGDVVVDSPSLTDVPTDQGEITTDLAAYACSLKMVVLKIHQMFY